MPLMVAASVTVLMTVGRVRQWTETRFLSGF